MFVTKTDEYILSLTDGIFHFYKDDDNNVCYRKIEEDQWGKEDTLIKDCKKLISVILSRTGEIYIIIQSIRNSIVMYKYAKKALKKVILLKSFYDTRYIKAVSLNNCIHLFFIKQTNQSNILYHQIIKSNLNVTSPIILDIVEPLYKFKIILKNKKLYLAYVRKNKGRNLVYRIYDANKNYWNKFKYVNDQRENICDYSFNVMSNEIIVVAYTLNINNKHYLKYKFLKEQYLNEYIMQEDEEIINPIVYYIKSKVYLTYIVNSKLIIKFINLNFPALPIRELIFTKESNCFKYSYQGQENIISNFINIIENQGKIKFISTILQNDEYIYKINNKDQIMDRFKNYENQIFKNYETINKLNYIIKILKEKLEYYEKIFNNMSYRNENENLEKLKDNIKFFQQEIINRENKITDLQNAIIKREGQINETEQSMEEYRKIIKDLNEENEKLKTDLSQYILKNKNFEDEIYKLRYELNDSLQKNNKTSIIKKLFNNE